MKINKSAGIVAGVLLAMTAAGTGVAVAADGGGTAPETSVSAGADTDTNQGPDADLTEPGHQDPSDAGDAPESGGE
ncbi:hypothetical protein [Aeromicrobium sp.]|uniref:hypothetical protein n=1 Tax=Aeromicrobium sp. TaxID=1871063 RepID=UPI003C41D352